MLLFNKLNIRIFILNKSISNLNETDLIVRSKKTMFLAKSNGESLIQHTNNLLMRCQNLQCLYPHVLTKHEWQLLTLACAYHDLGKINDKFQTKIANKQSTIDGEIPHGLLSVTMIDFNTLKKMFSDNELKALAYAVANHHHRNLSEIDFSNYQNEVNKLQANYQKLDLTDLLIDLPTKTPQVAPCKYYEFKKQPNLDDIQNDPWLTDEEKQDQIKTYQLYVKIKGLLNRLDYAASGHYAIESNPRLELDQNVLHYLGKTARYNDLQNWTYQKRDQSIIAIAQTGLGKTESALHWLDNDKSFFVLPLKTALNSMYDRFKNEIYQDDSKAINQNLALLHSDALSYVARDAQNEDFNKLINENKQFSKQLSLTTLDQVFNFVYHYPNYEQKVATLSYAKVVIDEIQMYSPDLLAYLIYGLKEIQNYGGKFYIMTATLAPVVLDLLKEYDVQFTSPAKPFLDGKINHRHKVKTIHQELTADDVLKLEQNKKTLVVVNTVKKANELYSALKDAGKNVHLIHSRFIRRDRRQKEKEINDFSKNNQAGIWIGTQVVEASLDIDFDLLITELSELSGLFQRMGRCYRKRNYEGENPNVYVFDGGQKATSGINRTENSVVDYQMYELSKNAIKNLNGYLSENDKIDLINQNYTSKNLQNGFAKQVKSDYQYLLAMQSLQMSKKQVKEKFRNLQTISVIPEQVYLDNKEKVDQIAQRLINKDYKSVQDAIELREKINDLCVNVYKWLANDLVNYGNLNKLGYHVLSKEYHYNSEAGLSIKKVQEDGDNFF